MAPLCGRSRSRHAAEPARAIEARIAAPATGCDADAMHWHRRYVDTAFGQAHVRVATPATDDGRLPLFCLPPQPLSGRALEPLLAALREACRAGDVSGAVAQLRRLVPEYQPAPQ